jgi:hypothetical protein
VVSNADEAGGGIFGDADGDAVRAAHQDLSDLAVDQHDGQTRGVGTKVGTGQLDFAERQDSAWHDEVNARVGNCFSGLRASTRHDLT